MRIGKVRSLTIGSAVLVTAMGGGGLPIAGPLTRGQALVMTAAHAASPARNNANGLLSDMRASLAMIAMSYKDGSGAPKHKSAADVLASVSAAAKATQRLETALTSRNSKAVSDATRTLSDAIGRLQTNYALTPEKSKQASDGLRYLNACWQAYSARYVLSKPDKNAPAIQATEIQSLRQKVAALSRRVSELEARVAGNAALRREVTRLRRDLAYFDSRPDDALTYQSMLLTLTLVSGSFDALVSTTRVHYPAYYVYFEPVVPAFGSWSTYWDGYYDGYYDRVEWERYQEPMVIDGPVIEIERAEVYQTVNYETIYNVTEETTIVYNALPDEDLSRADVQPTPGDTNFDADGLRKIEALVPEPARTDTSADDSIDPIGSDKPVVPGSAVSEERQTEPKARQIEPEAGPQADVEQSDLEADQTRPDVDPPDAKEPASDSDKLVASDPADSEERQTEPEPRQMEPEARPQPDAERSEQEAG